MRTHEANSTAVLRKRILRFLKSPLFARQEVTKVVSLLSPLGEVALFGGAVRDLALYGNAQFPNDIDLVVECDDLERIAGTLAPFEAVQNRYGGFTFRFEKWKFDVWSLGSTWAVRQGLVRASGLPDLIRTTFFDWDAVVYEMSAGRLTVADSYLERLSSGILGINLVDNPNPVGNAIRALRSYRAMRAGISTDLAAYVLDVMEAVGRNEFVEAERCSHKLPLLNGDIFDEMADQLREAISAHTPLPARIPAEQLSIH